MNATTLGALLDHPTAGALRMLSDGPGGLEAAVTGVTLVADVAARPAQTPGALIVVLRQEDRSDWRLDALLSRAQSAGAAGILLPGHAPLGASTRHLAARLGLAVLGAPDPLAAYDVVAMLLTRPASELARVVLATATGCSRAGDRPEDVVAAFAQALGREAAVVDQAGRGIIGHDPLGAADRERLAAHLDPGAAHPHALHVTGLAAGEVLALPVPGARQASWLCVFLPSAAPAECDAVEAALPLAAGAIRERLAQRRLGLERDARARTSLLEEVGRASAETAPALRRRALDLGWELDGWHVGVYVGVLGDVDLMGVREDLLRVFGEQSLDIEAVEQAGGWAVWTTTDREPSAEESVRHAAAVRRAQHQLETTVGTYVGVGRAQVGPTGIAASLAEARDAARLARDRVETGRFLHVDRIGFGQLLLGWTRTDSFLPAARALLEPLTAAPGDLVATLGAYLDCESSLAHAAAVLGVHRNTVAARIAKVQQLLAVDLENPDERLALHLACKTVRQEAR